MLLPVTRCHEGGTWTSSGAFEKRAGDGAPSDLFARQAPWVGGEAVVAGFPGTPTHDSHLAATFATIKRACGYSLTGCPDLGYAANRALRRTRPNADFPTTAHL